MQTKTTTDASTRRRRRPRAAPATDVLGAVAREERVARQLADDLAALVHAGLVAPTGAGDELRFAVIEPGDRAA
ncbi:MAG TPA: hypothetical protein VGW75_04790 [Solirubrobacteraceae bacterium]|jgi:hypothetical protein|nr:hypothetical protein [Solirubrobacteraceae bacterium]